MTEMILLSEAQMARISPFFPLSHGIPRVDDRRVIGGIIFVIRNGLRVARRSAKLRATQDNLQPFHLLPDR
jgi:transposase